MKVWGRYLKKCTWLQMVYTVTQLTLNVHCYCPTLISTSIYERTVFNHKDILCYTFVHVHCHITTHTTPILEEGSVSNLNNNRMPFHTSRKVAHHCRSEQNALLRQMWWWADRVSMSSSNILLINIFPGCTTWLAWANFPASDLRSLLVHDHRLPQDLIRCCNSTRFEHGSRITIASESSSKPKNGRQGQGLSVSAGRY